MKNPLPNYPGSKGGAGVAEKLISLMPPHTVYVEGFLGSGALLRKKKLAHTNIGIDTSYRVIKHWHMMPNLIHVGLARRGAKGLAIAQGDLVECLSWLIFERKQTLLYCDPPYLQSSRTRMLYDTEFHSPLEHETLLCALLDLKCMVMISHYPCDLYNTKLAGWQRVSYRCMTRGGPRVESCWYNFEPPTKLHDPRFAGGDYRERERIKRKKLRWTTRLTAMPPAERQIIAEALAEIE